MSGRLKPILRVECWSASPVRDFRGGGWHFTRRPASWPEGGGVRFVGTASARSSANAAEIQQRTAALAADDERRREAELIDRIIERTNRGRGTALGKEPTLRALTERRVMVVAAVRDFDGEAWQCTACQFVSGAPMERCPACGGAVEAVKLQDILPLLVRRNSARLELVGGEPAERLREQGGIGAVLRYVPETEAVAPR